jgi:hypothetical protein
MPISFSELANARRNFQMDTDFGPLRVSYRPYEMTPAREVAIARIGDSVEDDYSTEGDRIAKAEAGNAQVIAQFATVVEAWDFIGPLSDPDTGRIIVPEGEPVRVTAENLKYVSQFFMIQVLRAIAEDSRPKKGRSKEPSDT